MLLQARKNSFAMHCIGILVITQVTKVLLLTSILVSLDLLHLL